MKNTLTPTIAPLDLPSRMNLWHSVCHGSNRFCVGRNKRPGIAVRRKAILERARNEDRFNEFVAARESLRMLGVPSWLCWTRTALNFGYGDLVFSKPPRRMGDLWRERWRVQRHVGPFSRWSFKAYAETTDIQALLVWMFNHACTDLPPKPMNPTALSWLSALRKSTVGKQEFYRLVTPLSVKGASDRSAVITERLRAIARAAEAEIHEHEKQPDHAVHHHVRPPVSGPGEGEDLCRQEDRHQAARRA